MRQGGGVIFHNPAGHKAMRTKKPNQNTRISIGKWLAACQKRSPLCVSVKRGHWSPLVAASAAQRFLTQRGGTGQTNRKPVCSKGRRRRTLWTPCSISPSVSCSHCYRRRQMPGLDWAEAAGGGLTADGRPHTGLLFTSQLHYHSREPAGLVNTN